MVPNSAGEVGSVMPRVSVVIPVYNRGPLVGATVDSVLAQSLSDELYEIIVIDDGSTDDTPDYLDIRYGGNPTVRLTRQTNQGVAAARNAGLQMARGEFIAYLDHDDQWLPQKLELQLEAFARQPEIDVVTTLWEDLWEDSADSAGAPTIIPPDAVIKGRAYRNFLHRDVIISMSAPLIRTKALRAVGGFDTKTVPADDWDLWLRMARCSEFACVTEPLVRYCRHSSQQSADASTMIQGSIRAIQKQRSYVLQQFCREPQLLPAFAMTRDWWLSIPVYNEARDELFAGRIGAAWRKWAHALQRYPYALFTKQWLYLTKRLLTRNSAPY